MFLLTLFACFPRLSTIPLDRSTARPAREVDADGSVEVEDTASGCDLTLDPGSVNLTPEAPSAFVTTGGCEAATVSCPAPFTGSASVFREGYVVVGMLTQSAETVAGACDVEAADGGHGTLEVLWTPGEEVCEEGGFLDWLDLVELDAGETGTYVLDGCGTVTHAACDDATIAFLGMPSLEVTDEFELRVSAYAAGRTTCSLGIVGDNAVETEWRLDVRVR